MPSRSQRGADAAGRRRSTRAPRCRAAQPSFEPPHAIGSTDVAFPTDAPAITAPVVVTVKLLVDATGAVAKVDAGHRAAAGVRRRGDRRRARRSRSSPRPTAASRSRSRSRSRTRSCRAAAATAAARRHGPARTAVLRGKLVELGTRAPVHERDDHRRGRRHDVHRRRRRDGPLRARSCRRAPRRSRCTRRRTTRSSRRRSSRRKQELAVTLLRRARSLRSVRDRRRRRAAPRGGLADHAARPRAPAGARHVRRSVPRDPGAARRRVGGVAVAVPGGARREPELDRLPDRRHARPAAVPPARRARA